MGQGCRGCCKCRDRAEGEERLGVVVGLRVREFARFWFGEGLGFVGVGRRFVGEGGTERGLGWFDVELDDLFLEAEPVGFVGAPRSRFRAPRRMRGGSRVRSWRASLRTLRLGCALGGRRGWWSSRRTSRRRGRGALRSARRRSPLCARARARCRRSARGTAPLRGSPRPRARAGT